MDNTKQLQTIETLLQQIRDNNKTPFNVYGNVMSNDFTSGNYTSVGGATFTFGSGKITVSGGTGTLTKYLTYDQYISAAENFSCRMRYKILNTGATDYGLGIGVHSVNVVQQANAYAYYSQVGTASDTPQIYLTKSGGDATVVVGGTGLVPYSVNDIMEVALQRRDDQYTFFVKNVTTNTARTSVNYISNIYTYPQLSSTGELNNRFKLALYAFGGSQEVQGIWLDIYSLKGADLAVIGDSKTQGYYNGEMQDTLCVTLSYDVDNVVNLSGVADRTVEAVLCNQEVTNLAPKNVLMWIGCNDLRNSVPSATWQANYASIVSNAQAAGATVWHVLSPPEDVLDVTPLNTWINATYPASRIIDAYTPFLDQDNRLLAQYSSDGIHLSGLGIIKLKQLILAKMSQIFA